MPAPRRLSPAATSRRVASAAAVAVAVGVAVGLAAARAGAQDAAAPPVDGPRLVVEARTVRFDEVVQGAVLELRVPVRNAGTAPLVIARVEPSCGCTAARLPAAPIPPGGAGELVLRYDSTEKQGSQSIQLLVYSNDPTQQDLGRYCTRLMIQGDVRTLYRAQPAGAFFGEVVAGVGPPPERVLTVTGQDEAREGFTARLASAPPEHVAVELEPLPPAAPGGKPRGVKVHLRLLPGAPPGEVAGVVVLETDVPLQPRVRLPVVGVVVGRVVAPESVQLLRVPRGARVERRAILERRDGAGPLVVARVLSPAPWLEAAVDPVTAERTELRVTLREDAPPGPFTLVLRAVLADPPGDVLEVPVLGHVLPRVRVEPAAVVLPAAGGPPARDGARARLRVSGGRVRAARVEPADSDCLARVEGGDGPTPVVVVEPAHGRVAAAAVVIETDVPGEERLVVPIIR